MEQGYLPLVVEPRVEHDVSGVVEKVGKDVKRVKVRDEVSCTEVNIFCNRSPQKIERRYL